MSLSMQVMAKVPSIDDLPSDESIGVGRKTADMNECGAEEKTINANELFC